MNWLGEIIAKHVSPADTILDIGCGIMQAIDGIPCKNILGVDIWKPYLENIKTKYPTIKLDVSEDLNVFLDGSYDVVLCLDLLEHLDIAHVNYVLEHLTRICRKKAIIFTPSKFFPNEQDETGAWGLGDCEYQKHRCLVTLDQLAKNGFTVDSQNPDDAYFGLYKKR